MRLLVKMYTANKYNNLRSYALTYEFLNWLNRDNIVDRLCIRLTPTFCIRTYPCLNFTKLIWFSYLKWPEITRRLLNAIHAEETTWARRQRTRFLTTNDIWMGRIFHPSSDLTLWFLFFEEKIISITLVSSCAYIKENLLPGCKIR